MLALRASGEIGEDDDMDLQELINDIPYEAGYNAHRGTSFVPEQRAKQEQTGHAEWLLAVYNEVLAIAGAERSADLDVAFAEFRAEAKKRKLALLGRRSGMVSTMIAGPSNFNTRRAEKKNSAYDKALGEYVEWSKKAQAKLMKQLAPPVDAMSVPVRTGEADAVAILKAKIAKLEENQALTKSVNAVIRKHAKAGKDAQIAALVELGLNQTLATEMVAPGRFAGDGYAHFELSNNSANIRRLKDQLVKAERLATTETAEREVNGVRIVDNVEADRLQLFFPQRVSKDTYNALKSHGFRWTPSAGCFQAFRGTNANYWADQIVANWS